MAAARFALLVLALVQVYALARAETLEEAVNEERQPIVVDVYYESLCPDSMNFISKQLAPAYPGLKDYIHVTLVPFGKASVAEPSYIDCARDLIHKAAALFLSIIPGTTKWSEDANGRPYGYQCQHGPNECRGNQAHACALKEIETLYANNYEAQQSKSVGVIGCVMSSGGYATLVSQCATKNGMPKDSVSRIERCLGGNDGRNLFIEAGKKTNEVQKPLSFVPTIIINGEINSDAFSNFSKSICDVIPANDKPSACK